MLAIQVKLTERHCLTKRRTKQPKYPHSFCVITPLEWRFAIIKGTRRCRFFGKNPGNKYSLRHRKFIEVSSQSKDSLPESLADYADYLKTIQEHRKRYLVGTDRGSDKETNYEHGLKPLFRLAAEMLSADPEDPDTNTVLGLNKLKTLVTGKVKRKSQTNCGSHLKSLNTRLQSVANPEIHRLTVDDCMLLWELLAELCYEQLAQLATKEQRCDRFLAEMCAQSVSDWTAFRDGDPATSREPLRYYANGFSLLTRSEAPQVQPGNDPGETRERADTEDSYQSLGDPHAQDNPKFRELLHWHPNRNRRREEPLCRRADAPNQQGLRLLVTEDAGMGKSVFLQRLEAWFCEPEQRDLFGGKPPLVLRWQADGRKHMPWPTPGHDQEWRAYLRAELKQTLDTHQASRLEAERLTDDEVIEHVLRTPNRVVLLFDAFDQLCDPHVHQRRHLLEAFAEQGSKAQNSHNPDEVWKRLHVVVTSRRIAIRDRLRDDGLFQPTQWVIARLEGWTSRQQLAYLADLIGPALNRSSEVAHWQRLEVTDEAAATILALKQIFGSLSKTAQQLLQVPQILALVRQAKTADKFPVFRNRAELYAKTTKHLLDRGQLKKIPVPGRGEELPPDQDEPVLEDCDFYLSCLALEASLAVGGQWVFTNDDVNPDLLTRIYRATRERAIAAGYDKWDTFRSYLPKLSLLTHYLVTENPSDSLLAFKHREMMEFLCAKFLVNHGGKGWSRSEGPDGNSGPWTCDDSRLAEHVGNPQWNSTWQFALELIEINPELQPQGTDGKRQPAKPQLCRSAAASLSILFNHPTNPEFGRPTELINKALRLARSLQWPEFKHWQTKLQAEFQSILRDGSPDQARLAATLIPSEILQANPQAFGIESTRVAELLASSESASWVQCPPLESETLSEACRNWLAERRVENQEGTYWYWQESASGIGFVAEHPQHTVHIPRFWMQTTAVTVEQYLLFVGNHKSRYLRDFDSFVRQQTCPVIAVSWYDAVLFGIWVGGGCRLPRESEWEFACRSGYDGDHDLFSLGSGGSATLQSGQANFNGNYPYPAPGSTGGERTGIYAEETLPVRWNADTARQWMAKSNQQVPPAFEPNAWGLWQMHGNVFEWCVDVFDREAYEKANNPATLTDHSALLYTVGPSRVLRGGSWSHFGDGLRCALRVRYHPGVRSRYFGFRLSWGS